MNTEIGFLNLSSAIFEYYAFNIFKFSSPVSSSACLGKINPASSACLGKNVISLARTHWLAA